MQIDREIGRKRGFSGVRRLGAGKKCHVGAEEFAGRLPGAFEFASPTLVGTVIDRHTEREGPVG